jgi:AmmeMemoRadiSam system protein A
MTSDADRDRLLRLARDAIAAHVSGWPAPSPPLEGVLARRGGAFVTLHSGGSLRGCIGHVEDDEPLGRVIPRCAVSAATQDPRFPGLEPAELSTVQIELSLLGQLEPIGGPSDIEIGRHGLVVERGWSRGLLLPQVATEWEWDVETFLAHTCRKASLPDDSWKRGATLWRFEAEVFGEPD